jgi:hypothetical protein
MSLNSSLMVADILAGGSFQTTASRPMFADVSIAPTAYSTDGTGSHFLFRQYVITNPPPPFTVVLNWMAKLKQ